MAPPQLKLNIDSTSELVVQQAFQEMLRFQYPDYTADESFRKIEMVPMEFLKMIFEWDTANVPMEKRWDCNVRMDCIGKDNAIYLRHTNRLQLDLAAKFSRELANKIMALGDQESLRPLDRFATDCVTSFDERLLLWDEGSYQYRQQCLTSFRDPDVVLKLETAKSEIVIEITDPTKRLLCPRLGEDYIKRMMHPTGTQRANVLYISINLEEDSPTASYTVWTGHWRKVKVGNHWLLKPQLLRYYTVFRNRKGEAVPDALQLRAQHILGTQCVDMTFPDRKELARARATPAVTIDHEELGRYLEYAEKRLVHRPLPHIGVRELQFEPLGFKEWPVPEEK
ncbi:hypothetical protein HDK90DRAFT_529489 [Phyllosticta capitalensis]|uniref:Uncharacterized protein n=1 Tax=Phyllosticta capitalensis TaxID=121624 RepID=A0ABR1Y8R5_9PEZI